MLSRCMQTSVLRSIFNKLFSYITAMLLKDIGGINNVTSVMQTVVTTIQTVVTTIGQYIVYLWYATCTHENLK